MACVPRLGMCARVASLASAMALGVMTVALALITAAATPVAEVIVVHGK